METSAEKDEPVRRVLTTRDIARTGGCAALGFLVYNATLNVWAAIVTGAALAASTYAAEHLYGRQRRSGPRPADAVETARRGWGSWVICGIAALVGLVFLFVGVLDVSQSRSARLLYCLVGVACVGIAAWAEAGGAARLRVGVKQFSKVSPRLFQGLIGGLVIAAFGLVFGGSGLAANAGLRAHGVTTTATVTRVTHFKATTYFLEYTLPSGHTGTCSTEDVLDSPRDGNHIEVLYDSTDAFGSCQSADYGTDDTDFYVFLAFGITGLAASAVFYAVGRRRSPAPARS